MITSEQDNLLDDIKELEKELHNGYDNVNAFGCAVLLRKIIEKYDK